MIRAAKYLGVAPWELMERPSVWTTWAKMGEEAETVANNQQQAAANRKAARG